LTGAIGVIAGEQSERLLVSITLLQRSVSVALPRKWLCRVAIAQDGDTCGRTGEFEYES
jgi:hypothetical protein